MSKYIFPTKLLEDHNVEIVDHWDAPWENDARLIGMVNIPRALHLVNPRNLLGKNTWDHMRRRCYAIANDTCEICGTKPDDKKRRHAHEVYSIDYKTGTAKFERCVCLCYTCHVLSIHTGRALTLYKKQSPIMSKENILLGAENSFKIASEWNKDHDEKIKLYAAFLSYLKEPTLKKEMLDLIAKYKPEFYATTEESNESVNWGEWKLVVGAKEYQSPYQSEADWQAAMDEQAKKDTDRQVKSPLVGGIFDELDKMLSEHARQKEAERTEAEKTPVEKLKQNA